MDNNELINLLQQIKLISQSVLEHYNILATLECAGKMNSSEYIKNVELLQVSIQLEDSLYAKIANDSESLTLLKETNFNENVFFDVFSILNKNEEDLITKRIDSKIGFLLNEQYLFQNTANEEYKAFINNYLIGMYKFIIFLESCVKLYD